MANPSTFGTTTRQANLIQFPGITMKILEEMGLT